MADLLTSADVVAMTGVTPAIALSYIESQLGKNGIPATADAVYQALATNSPDVTNAIRDGLITMGATMMATGYSFGDMHYSDPTLDANIAMVADTGVKLLMQGLIDEFGATNVNIDSNSVWHAANALEVGHLELNFTATSDITTQVVVPAVYQSVTTTVPTSTDVTSTRNVTTTSYSTQNSSSIVDSSIPFMRSVFLLYKGTGFKPTSTYNAFFDGIDVTSYLLPAQELLISSLSGQTFLFDDTYSGGATGVFTSLPNGNGSSGGGSIGGSIGGDVGGDGTARGCINSTVGNTHVSQIGQSNKIKVAFNHHHHHGSEPDHDRMIHYVPDSRATKRITGDITTTIDIDHPAKPVRPAKPSRTVNRTDPLNPIDTLKTGDKITGLTSGATGILVGYELAANNQLRLFIVNVIGAFQSTETITGSKSGTSGVIQNIIIRADGEPVSSIYGHLYGLYQIPNDASLKFHTGTKPFMFSTGLATDTSADSFGSIDFTSNGILHTVQPVVTTIRNLTTSQESYTTTVLGTKEVTSDVLVSAATTQTLVTGQQSLIDFHQTCPLDPLAQSFFVSEETGIYITGIDLFFASKDPVMPINVSIRNTVNGYPGTLEITQSKVTIESYDVNISSSTSIAQDGGVWASANTPTRVTFSSPVFLQGNTEYCIFIRSDSFKYRLWTSYLGDSTVNGLGMTASQPVMGSLFKSQNANTWTTDQNQDLCFNLYRAKFDTSAVSNIQLKSEPLVPKSASFTPIYAKSGSSILRVLSLGHGFQTGHTVAISYLTVSPTVTSGSFVVGSKYVITALGSTNNTQWNTIAGTSAVTYIVGSSFVCSTVGVGTGTAMLANYFGFTSEQINGSHTVSNVEPDYYTITMPYAATSTGTLSDSDIAISRNITVDNFSPRFQTQKPIKTDIKYTYAGTTTSAVKSLVNTSIDNYSTVDTPETYLIMSPENEAALLSSGVDSLTMNVTLTSTSEFVSPMIDTHRMAVVTTGYKINNPTVSLNVTNLDYNTIASSSSVITVDYTNNKFVTANSAMKLLFSTIKIGQYITVSGCSNSANNGVFLVTSIASDGASITVSGDLLVDTSTSISMVVGTRFVSEISPGGSSSVAKYVSKPLTFANISTAFKIFFEYNLPNGCGIDFYYKTSSFSDNTNHSDLPYTLISYDADLLISSNINQINSGAVHVENISNFDTLSIKIVYTSNNAHKFPRMRDFRIVALA
jgi:hypothetical protein